MRFCIECGRNIEIDSAKFCPNCGKNLLVEFKDNNDSSLNQSNEAVSERSNTNTNPYSLGVKLEEFVEKILSQTGYSATRRQRLEGRSGTIHEINIVARKDDETMAIECKNCGEEKVVGITELRNFVSKLRDLHGIRHRVYATNKDFSSEAKLYAKENDIDLWNGGKLSNMSFSMNIGRFNSRPINQQFVISQALPVKTTYKEASKLDIVNPTIAKISKAELSFYPFHVFEYKIDLERFDRSGKNHRIQHEGIEIINGLNGKPIKKNVNTITDEKRYQLFFPKAYANSSNFSEYADEVIENKVMEELSSIESEYKYKIAGDNDYNIIIHESKVPEKAARKMVVENILEDNTTKITYEMKNSKGRKEKREMTIIPKSNEVRIWRSSLIYVPQWDIKFETKSMTYTRCILPASGTIVVDEISMCPRHYSRWKVWGSPKEVYALCDICGQGVCKEHVTQVNSVYICPDHTKSK